MKGILDPQGSYWNMIFIVSCLFSVLLDPLFLYIPIINEDMKCMKLDRNMKIAALFSRSVIDLFYIVDIIFQIYRSKHSGFRSGSTSILVDILAVLPLPHVAVLIFFSKMRSSSRSLIAKKVLNFLVMLQYVPRFLRIYLSCEELKKTTKESKKLEETSKVDTRVWVKGLLNFFLYIFASHVLGAIWYFFAFQQITTCWLYACRNHNECEPSTFDCHDHRTFRNLTFINDLCPINLPNATLFDFGIYLNILQSGLLGSTNFPQKFSNCFWWGLRNLSSFGQNLQPSIDTWENLFVVSISITGLLLFSYLIGNLQMYMQLKTTTSMQLKIASLENQSRKEKKKKKKELEIKDWLSKNGIPSFVKEEIMQTVEQELKEDRPGDVNHIISILPDDLQTYINKRTPLARLKRVSGLQNMGEQVLKAMSEKLKPKTYRPGEDIIEMGEPLKLLFIVHGRVSKIKDGVHKGSCGPLECYGEEELEHLEHLVSRPFSGAAKLPVSKYSVLADDDVEALVLTVEDLVSVLLQFGSHFGMDSQW